MYVTCPMPRLPPVTRAVIPWRDHLLFLLLISASVMPISLPSKSQLWNSLKLKLRHLLPATIHRLSGASRVLWLCLGFEYGWQASGHVLKDKDGG